MVPVVAAEKLRYQIGSSTLVNDASLLLFPGEFTVIVGPNGAGKSTLLRLLTGEINPLSGSLQYGSTPIGQLPAWRLACQRTVMAQAARLAFPFTVYEVVRLGVDGVGRAKDEKALQHMVAGALTSADITHLAARSYQTLSGGEQQRVQFARVLGQLRAGASVAERQVLFLDEPIASLDLCHQFDLLDTARAQADEGVAVLAVLHDLNLAITYADRLIVMKEGMIVAQGPPADVVSHALLKDVFEVSLPVETRDGVPCHRAGCQTAGCGAGISLTAPPAKPDFTCGPRISNSDSSAVSSGWKNPRCALNISRASAASASARGRKFAGQSFGSKARTISPMLILSAARLSRMPP
jgi:iron complex transport system ATP-binding protein